MSYGRMWQIEGGGFADIYEPISPQLFTHNRRNPHFVRDHEGRLPDGSYYSWVDGLLWIDSPVTLHEYKWDNEDLISFLDAEDQDDPLYDKVTWYYLCLEFQLGEQYTLRGFCKFPVCSDNYTVTITSDLQLREKTWELAHELALKQTWQRAHTFALDVALRRLQETITPTLPLESCNTQ